MHPEHRALTNNYYPILAAIIVRDGFGCACCGSTKNLVVDHVIPVRQEGKTDIGNLQLLCNRCNVLKSNQVIDYRPTSCGALGHEYPRYANDGSLIIRVDHWERIGHDTRYGYLDSKVLKFNAKRSIYVLFADGRKLNARLRNVYPPDLQHLFLL